jgi:hypothetical protein
MASAEPASDDGWFYVSKGMKQGPFTLQDIYQLVAENKALPDMLGWREGMAVRAIGVWLVGWPTAGSAKGATTRALTLVRRQDWIPLKSIPLFQELNIFRKVRAHRCRATHAVCPRP